MVAKKATKAKATTGSPGKKSSEQVRRRYKKMPKELRKNKKDWAFGAREYIMLPYLDAFAEAKLRGKAAEDALFEKLFRHYHAIIGWRLKDHEEPTNLEYDEKFPPPPEKLSDEDEKLRKEAIKTEEERIRRWMNYRLVKQDGALIRSAKNLDNPYATLLAKLTGLPRPPKALQGWQQMLKEEREKRDEEDADEEDASDDELSDSGASGVGKRGKLALAKFRKLPQEEQAALKRRGKDEAETAKKEWQMRLEAPPLSDPAEMQKCINNLKSLLYPIFNGIQAHTGLQIVAMVGGPWPNAGGEVGTRTFALGPEGATGLPFPKWQPKRFEREWVGLFKEYCEAVYPDEVRRARALDVSNAVPAIASTGGEIPLVKENPNIMRHRHAPCDTSDDSSSSDDEAEDDVDVGGKRKRRLKATAIKIKGQSGDLEVEKNQTDQQRTGSEETPSTTTTTIADKELALLPETEVDFTDCDLVARWNKARKDFGTEGLEQPANLFSWAKDHNENWKPVEAPSDAAEWFPPLLAELAQENHGANYDTLLRAYVALEQAYGWQDKKVRKGLSTDKRPKELEAWISKGRQRSPAPNLSRTYARFGRELVAWWISLQPRWRIVTGREKPIRRAGEDWEGLVLPGRNGLTSFVAGLQWWAKAEMGDKDDTNVKSYRELEWLMEDLTWVMQTMKDQVGAGKLSF